MTVITHNITAMNTQRQYGINADLKAKTAEKLASGYRINRAADDAAGLAISEKMRGQIRGLTKGVQNTEDGISLCHVADGALNEVSAMLHRMKELAVQSANGTNTDKDRTNLQDEVEQLLEEIDRIGEDTEFNTIPIFRGMDTLKTQHNNGTDDSIDNTTGVTPPSSAPTYTTVTRNYSITGNPVDTSITQYTISADKTNGVFVNGTTLDWSMITTANGISLAEQDIETGTYTFQYNGLNISFDVADIDTKESIVNALNGLSFDMDYTPAKVNTINSMSFKLYTPADASAGLTREEFTSLVRQSQHIIYADDTGVKLNHDGVRKSWNEIFTEAGLTEETAKQNGGTINLGANGKYDLMISFKAGTTISDLIAELNGVSFDIVGSVTDNTVINAPNPANTAITATCTKLSLSSEFTEVLGYDVLYDTNTMKAYYNSSTTTTTYPHNVILEFVPNRDVVQTVVISPILVLSDDSRNKLEQLFATGATTSSGSITLDFVSTNLYGQSAVSIRWDYPAGIQERDLWNAVMDFSTPIPIEQEAALEMDIKTTYTTTGLQANNMDVPESISFDIDTTNVNNDVANPVPTPPTQPPAVDVPEEDTETEDIPSVLKLWIQSGANEGQGMWLGIDEMNTKSLGINAVNISTQNNATETLIAVKEALAKLSKSRSKIGAQQNRLEHTVDRENVAIENLTASESRIRDADMAQEMVSLSKFNILEQAGQAMMAQANQSKQGVLELLSS